MAAASWASRIKAHSASKQPKPRKPRPIVKTTWAQTRAPNEETGDPGAVVDIYYTVDENAVTLTDKKGIPIGGKAGSYVLQPGEFAVRIASRLALVGREPTPNNTQDVSWVI